MFGRCLLGSKKMAPKRSNQDHLNASIGQGKNKVIGCKQRSKLKVKSRLACAKQVKMVGQFQKYDLPSTRSTVIQINPAPGPLYA